MKKYYHLTPWFPLTIVVFFAGILSLQALQILPSNEILIEQLNVLFEQWGYWALAVGVFFENLAYIGLYAPGAFIIGLSVVIGEPSLAKYIIVSGIVALSVIPSGIVNYYSGKLFGKTEHVTNQEVTDWKWFLYNHWNLNSLGLYYFQLGIQKKPFWRKILITPVIIWPYAVLICYITYLARDAITSDSTVIISVVLIIWVVYDMWSRYKNHHQAKPIAK